jgi:hypothetical protein
MQIHFFAPLERAYYRMKSALFQPFDLRTWMVIGFTAFLADLLNGGSGNGFRKDSHANLSGILSAPYEALDWLKAKPEWLILAGVGLVTAFAVLMLFLWISSRGKFMFLDNVVQRRALVSQPWHQFRDLSFSLFRWRVVFALIIGTLALGTLYHVWQMAYKHWNDFGDLWSLLPSLILWGAFLLVTLLAFAYVKLLLDHFIVPLMYKDNLLATKAWDKFLPLHWRNLGSFVIYALFILLIVIALVILVIIGGLFTCCLGFILLIIPYISSVVLLPFSYWMRAYSLEFLAQFGSEYSLLPKQTNEAQIDFTPEL